MNAPRLAGFIITALSATIGIALWLWPVNIQILGFSVPCGPAIVATFSGGSDPQNTNELTYALKQECAWDGFMLMAVGSGIGVGGALAGLVPAIASGRRRYLPYPQYGPHPSYGPPFPFPTPPGVGPGNAHDVTTTTVHGPS